VESFTYNFHLWEKDKVHRGYKQYSNRCKQEVQKIDLDFHKPLVITGHSIGSIAGALIAHDLNVDVEVILFGSPKLATTAFRDEIYNNKRMRIFNYINEGDIIASYPFLYLDHITDPIVLKNARTFFNPLTTHSMATYSHNIYAMKRRVEQKGIVNPFNEVLDIF